MLCGASRVKHRLPLTDEELEDLLDCLILTKQTPRERYHEIERRQALYDKLYYELYEAAGKRSEAPSNGDKPDSTQPYEEGSAEHHFHLMEKYKHR